ncbi:MAG: ATP-dependent Clp protease ATP-binding subunit [Clostridia bacterium]|nr:ATP-dependent Clp protease ATP-binding subunit [Clostridia bacterium]
MELKFNGKANKVLNIAEAEARKLRSEYIGTEHILLGLIMEPNSVAGSLFNRYGVNEEDVREKIILYNGVNEVKRSKDDRIYFSPKTQSVLEAADRESKKMNAKAIGTEHILMGLLSEQNCVAIRILSELGIDAENFIGDFVQMLYTESVTSNDEPEYEDVPEEEPSAQEVPGEPKSGAATLRQYGKNMTRAAREKAYDPVIGREKEINRVMEVLVRRTKNNPCLIGEPGVGKTAVVEGLAQMIAAGNVPEIMKNKTVISLDLSGMVAGAKYRGEFEERIKSAINEVIRRKDIILFIDEIHTIVGAGAAEGSLDAANILKPSLSRGELQVIGATTQEEYRKYIEKDSALERRFQPVIVKEPDKDSTLLILKGLRDKYEEHHNVKITDEALAAAVNLSERYINDRCLPDKAIDLMDEASSRKRLRSFIMPTELNETEEKIRDLRAQKNEAVKVMDFEKAKECRDEEAKLNAKLDELRKEFDEKKQQSAGTVDENDIAAVISDWTGIPVTKLGESEMQRLMNLENVLHERVIGQDEAVKVVCKAVRRGRTGLKDPKRPIGSFIFMGPTGVGKTELSRALAEALFGDEKSIIRIDMSEFMEKFTVSRLVGSPPGYVGFEEGGQLTEKVRRKPYSVVLFDEIEKAHPDVFNILLQIMEDGRLTDSTGREVDFKNTVVIMTSNVGAKNITEPKTIGFTGIETDAEAHERMKKSVMEELKKSFKPEFLNRVDDIIVFKTLSRDELSQIARLILNGLLKRAGDSGMNITYDDSVVKLITDKGYDPLYGARPIKREVQNLVEDTLSEEMLSGRIKAGDTVEMTVGEDGKIKYVKK